MLKFKKIICEIESGYIAVVQRKSPKSEKLEVAEFSEATKGILGIEGLGAMGLKGDCRMPLIELGAWNDCGEGNPRMHVFSLVINQKLVGYCPIGWHLVIEDYNGRRLDASGKPVESDDQLVVIVGQDFLARDFSNEPRLLKGWAVKGICILSEYQRRGLGKLLLRSALDYLGTNEKEVAYTPPLTPAGEALIKSLGLNMEDIRLSPSI